MRAKPSRRIGLWMPNHRIRISCVPTPLSVAKMDHEGEKIKVALTEKAGRVEKWGERLGRLRVARWRWVQNKARIKCFLS